MTTAYKDYVTSKHQALYICMHYASPDNIMHKA